MPYLIPFVPRDSYQSLDLILTGIPCILEARWNGIDRSWYLDAFETNRRPIASSMKVVLGAKLGRSVVHPLFTNRMFCAIDRANTGDEATFDDFGLRVIIAYFTELDIELAKARSEPLQP